METPHLTGLANPVRDFGEQDMSCTNATQRTQIRPFERNGHTAPGYV